MNDVYVVHFEFSVDNAIGFGILGFITLVMLLFVNTMVACFATCVYSDRSRRKENTYIFWLLFFTWPLYLLLVLVKMTLGGLAKLWSKI